MVAEQPFLGTVQRFGQNSRFLDFRGTKVKAAYFVNSVLRLNYKDLRLETHGIALLTLQEASGEVRVERSSGLVRTAVSWNLLIFAMQVKTAYFVNSVLRLNYKDLRLETHGIALLTLQEASGEVRVERPSGLVRTAVSWNLLIFAVPR